MADIEDKFPNSPVKHNKVFVAIQFLFRLLVVGTTFAAAYLMATNKQSVTIDSFYFDAKYSYIPSFKFFALANIIACGCSVVSFLLLCIFSRHGCSPAHFFFLFLHDLFMLCLVLGGCSAAMAIGYLGKYGNDHSGWMPICDQVTKFCNRTQMAFICSFLAVILLLILTLTSASKSRKV
ncbi:hypothetical protein JCGZ_26390 [Jatropha curcas]|uniref:CASP-like protein n=1 Tax=Jatropha curcas TaxID=180498 RepID=A0A067JSP9_JATCU|nr:CASP-like protein 1F1 [Jatropha curcas]KDP22559.1 hypothetical protein JCGZ_26390 [Jatropha curcas]